MKKRTKILATIGPSSDSLETIIGLIKAGVNVFRLNFSHGTHEYHTMVLNRIKEAMKKSNLIVGVLQDISGPKIRVGNLQEVFSLKNGDTLEFVKDDILGVKLSDNSYKLSINQDTIFNKVQEGENIYLCDGSIHTQVIESTSSLIKVKVKNEGKLSSKKGVNFPNTQIGIDVLTPKDKKDMLWGIENDIDFMAISFVQNAQDIIDARDILNKYNSRIQLFAKIEKFDAVQNINEILEVSDGIMVARGDLGIEIPYFEVPTIQKMIIAKANMASKPVITATQMLLSMTHNEVATRAEISDVANAVLDGTDAVMLSEESAVGHNPILAVETMVNTIQSSEKHYPYFKFSQFIMNDSTDSINESAVRLAQSLNSAGILTVTNSGTSAKKIARYRPQQDILAISHDNKTASSLTIVWGIVPAFAVAKNSLGRILHEVLTSGIKRGVIKKDKEYILTAGDPIGKEGSTNIIRVLKKYEMDFFTNLEHFKR